MESSILEVANVKCTGAFTHPSLIAMLCKMAVVSMSDSKEKCPPKAPLSMPKSKMTTSSSRHNEDKGNEDSEEDNEEEDE